MPSQVEESFIRILSLEIPSLLYNSIKLRAFLICPSTSKDNLKEEKTKIYENILKAELN